MVSGAERFARLLIVCHHYPATAQRYAVNLGKFCVTKWLKMVRRNSKFWIGFVLFTFIALGSSGCITVNLDLPDNDDVDEVSFELAPMLAGGTLQVLPALGGEVLTYRFRAHRRGMDPAEWNPFMVAHLKRALERRGVDTRRGKTVTVRLVDFEAGVIALDAGTRAVLAFEIEGNGFRKRYSGSASGLWISRKGATGEAMTEILASALGDEDFRALMR